ncbi:MAG TPA: chemotaxis protein CheW [Rhodopila sp.]|uniref:hybrid sensor histidine kinase/response regulator n=1 Tax=Rhodopila sp. TaxID=2480087 RepID=UPI002C0EEF33|nr:chemotaxis protein CheW [Rhodopila sp.]HVY18304.1 chemotaxis protein CheW [Rhodopila sp.]
MDDLLADFLTETNESLAELDVALVTLERTPDDVDTLSGIFRLVHTIKGTCGFLGLPRLERVAHAAENVLGRLRDRTLGVTPDIVSQVLAAIDRIKMIVAKLGETGGEPAGDDVPLIETLNATASGQAAPAPAPVASEPAAPAPAPLPEPDATAEAVPDPAPEPPPAAEPSMPAARTAARPAARTATPGTAEAAGPVAAAQTIRVTVDVLEDLMTLVSELVLTRNQLLQLARNQENSAFTVPLQRLSHITSDLQEGVMKTRMQPIGNAWNKLPRLVRDLAHEMGKKIELTMLGADTELDRQVLELIKDPLTHMVRNSGDHGLETPAERRAAGKPETGQIVLNAFHEGGHIILEISDDGRGLAVDRIKAKALQNGLATEQELAGMTEGQIQRFIFRAGFSTAAKISAVSGRGVGMDVVKTNIEKIGGTIDLKRVPNNGTKFTVKIPLTLAIVSALVVEASSERFAIPQISVVELVRARIDGGLENTGESVIERINDTPVLRLRNRLLPLVSLTELLKLGAASHTDGTAHVVVAQVGQQMMGIIVDRVFDTEEIVVKPVTPILRHVTMFSGNTILGDGSVIMILDPNGIARATGVGAGGDGRLARSSHADAQSSADQTAMLLFRAGSCLRMGVPLGLVARLEDIPRTKIETSSGAPVTQYRGKLMPLISIDGGTDQESPHQPLLVFAEGERIMGLMVDEIIDVVEDHLDIELASGRPGVLGTSVIGGQATDILDTGYWLMQAWEDWFRGVPRKGTAPGQKHVLLVDDSDFFRQLMVPTLGAAGYRVTTAPSAADALKLRDAGKMFDAIISDIDMPEMDGIAFAQAVRSGGGWTALPLIALSGHSDPYYADAGHEAGFTGFVPKMERERLITSLRACLEEPVAA